MKNIFERMMSNPGKEEGPKDSVPADQDLSIVEPEGNDALPPINEPEENPAAADFLKEHGG